ncbi:MAG: hypothetical protein JSS94_08985 [Bacteroidetes bacterium]|nr:hypothetical protein [Bacteroidota bacterium]
MKNLKQLGKKSTSILGSINYKAIIAFGTGLSFLTLFSCRAMGDNLGETEVPSHMPPLMGANKCGAFVAPGKWKEFACQNLGATPGKNPFEPIAENLGAKYQWGAFKDEAGRYISQDAYQAIPLGSNVPGWITYTQSLSENTKPKDSWIPTNPCKVELGEGWRVPTKDEWEGVIKNNKSTDIHVNGNAVGAMYGEKLFLPFSSAVSPQGHTGSLNGPGNYWSSTPREDYASYTSYHNMAYYLKVSDIHDGPFDGIWSVVNSSNMSRLYGMSIRCIKD